VDLQERIAALNHNKSWLSPSDPDSVDIGKQLALYKAQRYFSDTEDRKWLAQWSAAVVSIWLGFVAIVLISNNNCLHLTEGVLITLLGTTTLNILGLSFIVLRGHFDSDKEKA